MRGTLALLTAALGGLTAIGAHAQSAWNLLTELGLAEAPAGR